MDESQNIYAEIMKLDPALPKKRVHIMIPFI